MKPETYIPSDALKPYILSFLIQEAAEEQVYKVLPDTGLVMGFHYKGRLSRVDGAQKALLDTGGISGLSDRYRIFSNEKDTSTVLVFFKESGAAAFFREPLHELFADSVSLDNFMLRSKLLLFEEQLCEAASAKERIGLVEKFLTARLKPAAPDPLVMAALSLIHRSRGNIRIAELARQLHTSQSPLEKRFRKTVGTTPKKFASVVRMRNLLAQYSPDTPMTRLGYEAGFYDQAHFIKEFKTYTGDTPEVFFSAKEK